MARNISFPASLTPDFALGCGHPVTWRCGQHVSGGATSSEVELVAARRASVAQEKREAHGEAAAVVDAAPLEENVKEGDCPAAAGRNFQ